MLAGALILVPYIVGPCRLPYKYLQPPGSFLLPILTSAHTQILQPFIYKQSTTSKYVPVQSNSWRSTIETFLPSTMNYTRGGPSRATPSTTCQKCLKKDMFLCSILQYLIADFLLRHYSYECKAVVQERPYVSRPSRTQQLFNPKLVPKLMSDAPKELLRK